MPQGKTDTTESASPNEKLMTLEEVAQMLRVSTTTVRNYVGRGSLKVIRLGGMRHLRFRKSDIEDFLKTVSE